MDELISSTMKKLTSIYFILYLALNSLAQNVFNKTFRSINTNESSFAVSQTVIQLSDSNFLISGQSYNQSKMAVLKIDRGGDTIWSFVADYGVNGGDILLTSLESNDGNYVVGGVSANALTNRSTSILVKLSKENGDTIWCRKIGLLGFAERCVSIKQTIDNGFVFCGVRFDLDNSGNPVDSDFYLVKTDSMGIPEWERTYGGASYDFANAIEIADDDGFMLFGTTYSYGEGPYNMYLIKTDSLGNQLWQKTYGGVLEDYGTSVCKLNDGNFVLAGVTYLSSDSTAAFVLKIDPEGNIIWQTKFRGLKMRQEFTGVKQLSNGEIIACGNMKGDDTKFNFYGVLYKINNFDGSLIWNKKYDFFDSDSTQHYFYGMDVSLDGGLVAAGMYRDLRTGASPGNSMWVVKTDCLGNDSIWDNACDFTIGLEEIEKDALFNLYPNPSTGAVTLDYFIPQNAANQSVSFYDATGKLVQKVDFTGEGQIQLNIDCSGFSNGVYQCVLVSDGEVMKQGKLVLIK
jgi:hypothetical protein